MDEYFLLLYIDSDYIYPVIGTIGGDYHRYNTGGDPRLWLYFREDPNTTDLLYGQDNQRQARLNKSGYFGAYWNEVSLAKSIKVHGVNIPYIELIKSSGLIRTLVDWYSEITHKPAVSIPTICLFSESIEIKARKNFVNYISEDKFDIRSYSQSFTSLAAAYCNRRAKISAEASSRMVIISASGEEIQISSMIFWDGKFVECDEPVVVKYDGENPVLMALAKHIVDSNCREHTVLRDDQIEREYKYQMQFAREWIKQAETISEDDTFRVKYHLSLDPQYDYYLNIRKSFILNKQRDLSRPITDAIEKYCSKFDVSNIKQYLYMGELFGEDDMYKLCTKHAPQKSVYIARDYYAEILNLYLKSYGVLKESLVDFEKIIKSKLDERRSATQWVKQEDKIIDLQNRVNKANKTLYEMLSVYQREYRCAIDASNNRLLTSDFDSAEDIVFQFSTKDSTISEFVQITVVSLLEEHECNINIYHEVSQYPYAKGKIDSINKDCDELEENYETFQKCCKGIKVQVDNIRKFRDNFPKYQKLKSDFERSKMLSEKRQLIAQMREITGEILPEDIGDKEAVKGKISSVVDYKKSFFGLFKKPSKLTITVSIGDTPIPYQAIVMISDQPIALVDKNMPNFIIKRGRNGIVVESFELPFKKFSKAKRLNIRLMIDNDKENVVDISKVSFNNHYVNLK